MSLSPVPRQGTAGVQSANAYWMHVSTGWNGSSSVSEHTDWHDLLHAVKTMKAHASPHTSIYVTQPYGWTTNPTP
jgi:hypothetical protein